MPLTFEEIRRQMLEDKARQAAEAPAVLHPPPGPGTSEPGSGPAAAATARAGDAPRSQTPWLLPAEPAATAPAPAAPAPPPSAPPPLQPRSAGHTGPMSVQTFTRLFKLGVAAAALLGTGYFSVKIAYPFIRELTRPGAPGGVISKDAPTSVKILRQTRGVVAKNNANVDRLNTLIDDPLGLGAPAATASLPPQPEPPAAKPKPYVRLEPLAGLVLDELHVSGVIGGNQPRIMINGLLVGLDGIVDNRRRLRFVSLNETRRVIVFGNGQETIEKPY